MDDMAELLDLHEMVDLDGVGLADTVDVVAGEIDEHDVFGPVFLGRAELFAQDLVLCTGMNEWVPR